MGLQKNVTGQKWIVFAFDRTDNTAKTGDAANITANLRLDGGAANAVDDTNPTELEDGYYAFDLTQAETNADLILIAPASSTSDIQVIGVPGALYTSPPNFNALGVESDGDLTKVNTLDGHTAQTGDNYARLGAPAGASVSADVAAVKSETALIVADTNELQTDWADGGRLDLILDAVLVDTGTTLPATLGTIDGIVDAILVDTAEIGTAGAGLTDLGGMSSGMKAEVNAEMVDVLVTDTHAEPGSVPAATASLKDKLSWLFTLSRNKATQTATTKTIRNDADSADIATSTTSDDGTTYTEGEWT